MAQSSILLRIGTRGSPLALAQAEAVRAAIVVAHALDPAAIGIEVIRTTGDRIQDRPLSEAGGKALFTKEIEEALLADHVDIAVHSAKDLPTLLPDRLALAACLPREDARDAFISRKADSLALLPPGSMIGTASLRRQAMVKRLRPDVNVTILRGNVETRLKKIATGQADATLLALAGLRRLGLEKAAATIMPVDEFLPAVGQGAIAIETRARDPRALSLLAAVDHHETSIALACERAFLAELDGSCRTPIAGHAAWSGGRLRFRGMILKPDGSQAHETAREGRAEDAVALGVDAGRELKARGGPDFFAYG
jgi:hydroxymethylbilane synthase